MQITVEHVLQTAAHAFLFHASQGQAFITLPLGASAQQAVPLRSAAFQHWIIEHCCRDHGAPPSANTLSHAIRVLEARAQFSESAELHHRFASTPDQFILDLQNANGEVVEITPQGWTVAPVRDLHFRAGRNAHPLPAPERAQPSSAPTESLSTNLAHLLNLPPAAIPAVLAWLLAALQPTGPYPILVLRGPTASGKSTTAELLRSLIDPCHAPLRSLPSRASRLLPLAYHQHVLAFDNIGTISARAAESLTAISTGDCFDLHDRSGPAAEPIHVEIQRPIILVLAPHCTLPSDLADHAIEIHLPELRPQQRRSPIEIRARFHRMHAVLLGQLCDAISAALAHRGSIQLTNAERFTDSAAWISAAAPVLDIPAADLICALNRRPLHPLALSVLALVESRGPWTGTATELFDALASAGPQPWTTTPQGLSQRLRVCPIPGIRAVFAHTRKGSLITLERICDGVPAPALQIAPKALETKVPSPRHKFSKLRHQPAAQSAHYAEEPIGVSPCSSVAKIKLC